MTDAKRRGVQSVVSRKASAVDLVLHEIRRSILSGELPPGSPHPPVHLYRPRVIGGGTSAWGGRCVPYDPIDFERRAWVEGSGWPIGYEDLLPHYVAANSLAEAGRYAYDAREAFPWSPPMIAGFSSEVVRTTGLERFSCPTDFGRRYERRLRVAPDIRVLQGAVCIGIRLAADSSTVRMLVWP